MKKSLLCTFGTVVLISLSFSTVYGQANKVLFDATSAQMAGNADWVLDADQWNLGFPAPGLPVPGAGNEANPARYPTPAQSGINSATGETYWKGGLSSFGVSLVKLGYTVETLPYTAQITFGNASNAQDLSNYKVFVVTEPNILYSATAKAAIVQFVNSGGGLLMVGNHFGSDRNNDTWDAPEIWNDLMADNGVAVNPFGITFDLQSFSQTSSNRLTATTNKVLNGSQGSVSQIQYSSGTSMTINPAANATVKGLFWKTGATKNNFNILLAQANYGSGRVVALGDSSPVDDGSGDTNDQLYNGFTGQVSGNHKKMLLNAIIWLAGNAGQFRGGDPDDRDLADQDLQVTPMVQVMPNPATELIHILMPVSAADKQVQVMDISGKIMYNQTVSGDQHTLDCTIASWPAGVFWVKVTSAENGIQVTKLIKQ